MNPTPAPSLTRSQWGLAPPQREFWGMLSVRIVLAGGFYPILVLGGWWFGWVAIGLLHAVVTGGWQSDGVIAVLWMCVGVPFVAVQAFVMGFMWAGIVSLFFVPMAATLRRLLDWPAHLDTAGKLTGGLIAYLATLPAALLAAYNVSDTFDFLPALFVFAHCGLAIAMGQAAGCLAAVADLRRRRRGKLSASSLRFGVWQLLALTVPVAVVLSILKAADMLNPPMALASIAAAFCAVATWQPVTWLVNRWLDRRLAKRRTHWRVGKDSTWYR